MSLCYRIAGLTFLLITATVCCLLWLANLQMHNLFVVYVQMPHMDMGQNEMTFLHSVHESLIWVGALFIILGFIASFVLAKSITKPLQALTQGTEAIRQGKMGIQVEVTAADEIGQLAQMFNNMSRRLAQVEEMRRRFLADTAHELRTPLAILQGNLENMLAGVSPPNPERLFSMQEEVQRLTRLVENLRDLSLARLHKLPLHKELLDMNQLLLRALDMFQPLLEEHRLVVVTDLTQKLPPVYVDGDRINQVLYNLISNAIRYSPPGGQLKLRTGRQKRHNRSWLVVDVLDTGTGISAEDLPYLFDYFYRGDEARSRETGGTGIGLSLVQYYCEAHDGWAEAHNNRDGGACFSIGLPLGGAEIKPAAIDESGVIV